MPKKPIRYPKCYVCGKDLKSTYIIAYVINGKQRENGVKICTIECERKLDEKI